MNELDIFKRKIGELLTKQRKERGLSKYRITQQLEQRPEVARKIESGKGYTIDSLLTYLSLQDIYIYFGDKCGNIYSPNMYLDIENDTKKIVFDVIKGIRNGMDKDICIDMLKQIAIDYFRPVVLEYAEANALGKDIEIFHKYYSLAFDQKQKMKGSDVSAHLVVSKSTSKVKPKIKLKKQIKIIVLDVIKEIRSAMDEEICIDKLQKIANNFDQETILNFVKAIVPEGDFDLFEKYYTCAIERNVLKGVQCESKD